MAKHRYTGNFPPLDILKKFPNWEYALDEEGEEGQDETTIRPQTEQSQITSDTVFTAAVARQANGELRTAILALNGAQIDSVDVFTDPTECWSIRLIQGRWQPFDQNWLPEEERMPVVPLSDETVFPLEVESVLPHKTTGSRLTVRIEETK